MSEQRSAVITGSNSGFGRQSAELLLADGWRVFATMRNAAGANATAASQLRARGAEVVELDVTSDSSVDAAASKILAKATPDLLVNNAGAAFFGVVESFTPAAVERQFAINVFGPLRVNRAFLPAMRARHRGLVVYVSSIVGRLTTPLGGVYAASKWALEALAETSAYELAPQGVDVAIVQPGAYPTEIGAKRGEPDDAARMQAYGAPAQDAAQRVFGSLAAAAQGRDPADVARAIVHLADLPQGQRPLRVSVPHDDHAEAINAAAAAAQRELLDSFGLSPLAASR
ncbi:MAG TPA: SDR family oxidoreductase [Candidatus Acidoferrales bacterium]|nr:SDR family oxidoreductase [Candidatus Acidoferrales bacterium]